MDIPYKVTNVMLLSAVIYFHEVVLLQQIIAGSKMIIFSGAVFSFLSVFFLLDCLFPFRFVFLSFNLSFYFFKVFTFYSYFSLLNDFCFPFLFFVSFFEKIPIKCCFSNVISKSKQIRLKFLHSGEIQCSECYLHDNHESKQITCSILL